MSIAVAALAAVVGGGGARADEATTDGVDALPGLVRVASAEAMPGDVALALASGYGFLGAALDSGDSHHRLSGQFAASWRAMPWLAVGLRVDGRYDKHLDTPEGNDDGWVGIPRLHVRAVRGLGGGFRAGIEAGLAFPADSPLSFDGVSFEARGIATHAASETVTLSINAGARIDRSSETVDDPDALSLADRMALGASDAHAVTLGAGAEWRFGALAVVGEWSWDVLVGGDAPGLAESPMRVAVGARVRVHDALWIHGITEVGVSATPEIMRGAPLVPVEPRVTVVLGMSYRWGRRAARASGEERPPAPQLGTIRGRVLDAEGAPIAGALVRAGDRQTVTDDHGRFELTGVPAGVARVEIVADGHHATTTSAEVGADGTVAVEVALERELPPGQIRGLVRTLTGAPIPEATITIEPLGQTLTTADDGSFRIDVPPGAYEVEIRAQGHASQMRSIQVDQDGVTVINVELRGGGEP